MSNQLNFAVCNADEQFLAYIMTVWTKNARIKNESVRALIKRGAQLTCAVAAPEDPNFVLGWLCWERPNFLHYVYTRDTFRGQGVAHVLLARTPLVTQPLIWCSAWSRDGERFIQGNPAFQPIIPFQESAQCRETKSRSQLSAASCR